MDQHRAEGLSGAMGGHGSRSEPSKVDFKTLRPSKLFFFQHQSLFFWVDGSAFSVRRSEHHKADFNFSSKMEGADVTNPAIYPEAKKRRQFHINNIYPSMFIFHINESYQLIIFKNPEK
jgi:hypothetical protein